MSISHVSLQCLNENLSNLAEVVSSSHTPELYDYVVVDAFATRCETSIGIVKKALKDRVIVVTAKDVQSLSDSRQTLWDLLATGYEIIDGEKYVGWNEATSQKYLAHLPPKNLCSACSQFFGAENPLYRKMVGILGELRSLNLALRRRMRPVVENMQVEETVAAGVDHDPPREIHSLELNQRTPPRSRREPAEESKAADEENPQQWMGSAHRRHSSVSDDELHLLTR